MLPNVIQCHFDSTASLHFVLWQHVHNNFLYGTNLFVDCVSTFSLEQSRKKFGNCIMTSATVVSSSLENY
ncbi:hypothetical protein EB796_006335 [Bugula neritina]|uniref:Uncharacterized protein n=1 Tax=Bugula neritina TaxID=10212 RepID=A0A7J7KCM8_BUGNE|nr:hypothetical protein EB796_006335 [Bugula neritina]